MRTPNGPRSNKGGLAAQKVTAIILIIVGSILCIPFTYDMMFAPRSVLFTLWDLITVVLLIAGSPLFMYGVSSLFARRHGGYSTTDLELGRIRHTVEQDSWRKK